MTRMRRALPLMLLLVLLIPVSVAHASADAVIKDCTDDEVLQGTYTQKELAHALAKLGADSAEYTNCAAVIHNAQLALASGGKGNGGGTSPGGSGSSGSAATNGDTNGTGTGQTATTPVTPTPATSGNAPGAFGGFSGYPSNPAQDASQDELAAIAQARNDPTAARDTQLAASTLPAPVIIALAAGAVGLLVLLLLDLQRRVVARRP